MWIRVAHECNSIDADSGGVCVRLADVPVCTWPFAEPCVLTDAVMAAIPGVRPMHVMAAVDATYATHGMAGSIMEVDEDLAAMLVAGDTRGAVRLAGSKRLRAVGKDDADDEGASAVARGVDGARIRRPARRRVPCIAIPLAMFPTFVSSLPDWVSSRNNPLHIAEDIERMLEEGLSVATAGGVADAPLGTAPGASGGRRPTGDVLVAG